MVYWFVICGSSVFLAYLVRAGVGHFIRDEFSLLFDALSVFGMTVVFSPLAYGLTVFMSFDPGAPVPDPWRVILFVFLVATIVHAIRRIHRYSQMSQFVSEETGSFRFDGQDGEAALADAEAETEAEQSAIQQCRLQERLPEDIRTPILHLSARDHFVDVETHTALYSLRMRFSDAVAEMNGVEGYNTHRSHWVSRAAICENANKDGKLFLILVNGTRVPVSRSFRPHLTDAGLIEGG